MSFVAARGLATLGEVADAAARARAALGAVPGAGLDLDETSLAKLRWLQRDGRDFRAVTPQLQARMGAAFAAAESRVLTGAADIGAPWRAAVEAYRDHVSQRLLAGGLDVKVKPDSAETIKRKGHSRVGYASGDLQRAVAGASVRNTR